jgi:hypothetical protein
MGKNKLGSSFCMNGERIIEYKFNCCKNNIKIFYPEIG